MFDLDDCHWRDLKAGHRISFDPRPQLLKLQSNSDTKSAWSELWENLHHQRDVGEASYAAVPDLVRIYSQAGVIDCNTYAIVAVIQLARDSGNNPEVPNWLENDYFRAIREQRGGLCPFPVLPGIMVSEIPCRSCDGFAEPQTLVSPPPGDRNDWQKGATYRRKSIGAAPVRMRRSVPAVRTGY